MCFSEEVINDQGCVLSSIGQFKNSGSIIFDKGIDLSWHGLIADIDLGLPLRFCLIWLGSGSLASTGIGPIGDSLLSSQQLAFAI